MNKKYYYRFPEAFSRRFTFYAIKKMPENFEGFIVGNTSGVDADMDDYLFTDKEVASYPEDIQKVFQACIKEEVK